MISLKPFNIHSFTLLTMVISFSIFRSSDSFVMHRQKSEFLNRKQDSQLRMNLIDPPSTLLTLASPLSSASLFSAELPDDAESELLGEASHISDFLAAFRYQMNPLSFSMLAICSRICCISSDFLPDHNVLPSEIVYQSIMLAITSVGALKTLKTAINSQGCTIQHQRCYVSLFRPAGLSWIQFKQISESGAFEWMEVSPGSTITSNEYSEDPQHLYWLRTGNLEFQSSGTTIQMSISKSQSRLFGNLRFPVTSSTRKKSAAKVNSSFTQGSNIRMTVKAGPEGAKVLRIDTVKLKKLMDQDSSLNAPIQSMLLEGMKANMASLILSQQNA
mmetsp:Transcript_14456/g.21300  ORF Transcript_14456/g.21300 Transcript_14456/m.21300 type:complete len:331 (+) Transcript_14456:67-1059(+)|eukprot:CAMPEP_0194216472 /NCGR_PEP_ID=MMETSP0156-20130528/19055_1 /TAXON_ID=33649 /ORGANISM="Thalassionema nitzschioides, Strain L26-B" /LENGTH=330 /DNA_ID=CAMNT_0038945255 /DNA_START=49 /DNA_END=1041 /DNA_ORIENTATION=+